MWRYAAAQAVGTSHVKSGAPCQDRYAHLVEGEGLIIAVSDGAGSAEMSGTGAEIAVETAVAHLRPHLGDELAQWETLIRGAACAAKEAVQVEAAVAGRTARYYACTLLLVVLDDDRGAALQIGDGLIAYRDDEAWGWLFWPQKGEYANTTGFLTEDSAEQWFQTTALRERLKELAVMSDGLEGLALHFASQTVHEPFLETVMAPLRAAEGSGEAMRISRALDGFLRSDRIVSRTDDDLTLVLATRAPA